MIESVLMSCASPSAFVLGASLGGFAHMGTGHRNIGHGAEVSSMGRG